MLETLPKPVNDSGKMPPMSFGGTYTLERVLGTVPVEPDGSAYLEVPALRSLFFVALDEHDNSVKRMQSFLTVMPGETTSCVGCHEQRTADAAQRRPQPRCWPCAGRPAGSSRSPAFPTCSISRATSSRSSTGTACAATTTSGRDGGVILERRPRADLLAQLLHADRPGATSPTAATGW